MIIIGIALLPIPPRLSVNVAPLAICMAHTTHITCATPFLSIWYPRFMCNALLGGEIRHTSKPMLGGSCILTCNPHAHCMLTHPLYGSTLQGLPRLSRLGLPLLFSSVCLMGADFFQTILFNAMLFVAFPCGAPVPGHYPFPVHICTPSPMLLASPLCLSDP